MRFSNSNTRCNNLTVVYVGGRLRKDLWRLQRNTLDILARSLQTLPDHSLEKLVK